MVASYLILVKYHSSGASPAALFDLDLLAMLANH